MTEQWYGIVFFSVGLVLLATALGIKFGLLGLLIGVGFLAVILGIALMTI